MRPTSAFCRHADARARRGFTLLELLLVMALAALLTGLVAPRMWQWVEGARLRAGVDAARASLEALPRQAFGEARRVSVGAGGASLRLPEGWRLELSAPLVYEANGMTTGGRVRLEADRKTVADWIVVPPAGTVRNAEAADGPFRAQAEP